MSLEKNDIFIIFAQNINFGYTLEPPVLTSTRNLCFESKVIKKIVYPYIPQFYNESGV